MCGLSFALAMSHHDGSGFGLGGSVAAWTEFDYGNSMTEVLTPLVLLTAVAVCVGGVALVSPQFAYHFSMVMRAACLCYVLVSMVSFLCGLALLCGLYPKCFQIVFLPCCVSGSHSSERFLYLRWCWWRAKCG